MTPTNTEALAAELREEVAGLLRLVQDHRQMSREAAAAYRGLEAERDALKADAERYRALRDDEAYPYAICIWDQEDGYAQDARSPAVVDAAIDAAMKGTQ